MATTHTSTARRLTAAVTAAALALAPMGQVAYGALTLLSASSTATSPGLPQTRSSPTPDFSRRLLR